MNKLIAMGSLVLAFGSGTWCGYTVAPATEAPAATARSPIPALVNRDRGLVEGRADVDSSALRALIREEMEAALTAQPRPHPAVAVSGGQVAASPETAAKRREAEEQIDAMLAQGTWGNDQRFNFQQNLSLLDADQREHALQQLTTAINNGTLQVNTDGPPL
jgi:hypothetical protein